MSEPGVRPPYMQPSQRLVYNLVKIRAARRLTWEEISYGLRAAGHPIPVLGLRRVVAGQRRLDLDEVAALALLLGVRPWWRLAAEDLEVTLEVQSRLEDLLRDAWTGPMGGES